MDKTGRSFRGTFRTIKNSVHKTNLDTMKLLLSEDWCQGIVKKAREVGRIPAEGYKDAKKLIKKADKSSYIFTWQTKLESNPKRHKKFFSLINEIVEKAHLPEHFRPHLLLYILYNKISAPPINFMMRKEFNFKKAKEFPQPSPKIHSPLHNAEYQLIRQMDKWLTKHYPPLLKKRFKPYKQINRDLKIVSLSKKKGKSIGKDGECQKVEYSDYDIVDEIWGDNDITNDKKRKSAIRKARERVTERKRKRGIM